MTYPFLDGLHELSIVTILALARIRDTGRDGGTRA